MRKLFMSILLIVVAVYGIGGWLFLRHEDDELTRPADAVVVLAGGDSRLPVAMRLVRDGAAPVLIVSEEVSSDGDIDEQRARLCEIGKVDGAELVCAEANPYSTRGEARLVARLAEQRGWDRLAIVTSRYHLFRTEWLFRRCLPDVELVMQGARDGALRQAAAVPFEWAKLALAETLRRGC